MEMETASEAGLPPRGDDGEVKSALWLVTILIDDMSDYLAVLRLTAPTVEDIVSYERRQAWVANFIEVVQARAAEGGCCHAP